MSGAFEEKYSEYKKCLDIQSELEKSIDDAELDAAYDVTYAAFQALMSVPTADPAQIILKIEAALVENDGALDMADANKIIEDLRKIMG